jgi:hypothetical protein
LWGCSRPESGDTAIQRQFYCSCGCRRYLFPEKIAKLLDGLQKAGKSSGLAYSWSAQLIIWKPDRCKVRCLSLKVRFLNIFYSQILSVMPVLSLIRKSCFDAVGLYNTTFFSQKAQGCEDYDIYLRIAENFEFKLIREFLTGYRKTGQTMSDNYKAMERSRQLVFRDQKTRNPWIPDVIF